MDKRRHSLTYVLRLWPSDRGAALVWCASLHNPYTEERHAFANLASLVAFLEEKTSATAPEDEGGRETE